MVWAKHRIENILRLHFGSQHSSQKHRTEGILRLHLFSPDFAWFAKKHRIESILRLHLGRSILPKHRIEGALRLLLFPQDFAWVCQKQYWASSHSTRRRTRKQKVPESMPNAEANRGRTPKPIDDAHDCSMAGTTRVRGLSEEKMHTTNIHKMPSKAAQFLLTNYFLALT